MSENNNNNNDNNNRLLYEMKDGLFGRAEVHVIQYTLDWDDIRCELFVRDFPRHIWRDFGSTLQKFFIQNCPLSTIPTEIGNLRLLKELSLDHCRHLRDLPSSIGSLQHLETLIIKSTAIERLPPEIGKLTKLNMLHLDNNERLATLPVELRHTPLKRIELLNYHFPTLPDELFRISTLKELHLEVCEELTELPSTIGLLANSLESLDIRYCHGLKTTLPKEIGQLTNLRGLWIHASEITALVPDGCSIANLQKLQSLTIRSKNLIRPPKGLEKLTNLECLELQCDRIGGGYDDEEEELTKRQQPKSSNNKDTINSQACNHVSSLGQLTKLRRLEIDTAKFLGLPSSLLKNLQKLHLTTTDASAVSKLFAKPWYKSCGLEELELHICGCSDTDFVHLLESLPASLRTFSICKCSVTNYDHFLTIGLPRGIRILSFTNCSHLNDNVERPCLEQLMERYPQLGSITGSVGGTFSAYMTYLLCFNSCGRVLLLNNNDNNSNNDGVGGSAATAVSKQQKHQRQQIPLSFWPTVLARVKDTSGRVCRQHFSRQIKSQRRMEASVIYRLLHGRALLCRSEAPETEMMTTPFGTATTTNLAGRKRRADGEPA